MSALLEIEDLQVSFGGRTAAVRGASLRVEKGEAAVREADASFPSYAALQEVPSPLQDALA